MDCDDTLAPDTTEQLIRALGGKPREFWHEIAKDTTQGWDPPLVWIPELSKLAQRHGVRLTRQFLDEFAKKLDFYPGAPESLAALREWFEAEAERNRINATLRSFVISGGLEDMLVASKLNDFAEIYGCTLDFDESDGAVDGPKSVVTFTEKTRYLFSINKGFSKAMIRKDPGLVNRFIPASARAIPLHHMIYIGDGPTDVPCFSIINRAGGHTIGISKKRDKVNPAIGIRRVETPDYRPRWGPYTADYTIGRASAPKDRDTDLIATVKDLLLEMISAIKST